MAAVQNNASRISCKLISILLCFQKSNCCEAPISEQLLGLQMVVSDKLSDQVAAQIWVREKCSIMCCFALNS